MEINEQLSGIFDGVQNLIPEIIIAAGLLIAIVFGSIRKLSRSMIAGFALLSLTGSILTILNGFETTGRFFYESVTIDTFSSYLKILIDLGGIFTLMMSLRNDTAQKNKPEYIALVLTMIFGAHFLAMSSSLPVAFISMEIVSICSYLLAGFSFSRTGSEGSLKYFLYGAVASAVMLYGFSILYGLTGTVNFTSEEFFQNLVREEKSILLLAGTMALAGFLFKLASAPFHAWAPDVYQAAPVPVVALLSTVPKFAGLCVLSRFILAMNAFGMTAIDWQWIVCLIAFVTIAIGNFAALSQRDPKRMMAWSSIAQAGFMLIGIASFSTQGLQFMVFYATIYLILNFVVFISLNFFEQKGIYSISEYSGVGKVFGFFLIAILIAMVGLAGLPPTSGFTAKLFIFSALWQSYEMTGKPMLVWLLVFGLLNTVVSLFYYLKIPYYGFLRQPGAQQLETWKELAFQGRNFLRLETLLGTILVLLILALFFAPGLLMGWINRVNFVL